MNHLKRPIKKTIKKALKLGIFLVPISIFYPFFLIFYLVCGGLDVCRNKPTDADTVKRYFTGNGILTWLLSPVNLCLDLISHKNKGIYRLEDLPQCYQAEISSLLQDFEVNSEFIKQEMVSRLSEIERGMLFFKWYGDNLETSIKMPCFHKDYQYIKTIGVSVFNRQKATSTHFGPLRITLRLLYNLSPTKEGDVYIQVGGKKHYWRDEPLFIFDDTLQHKSVNYSEELRYCMFVDIIRPTKFTPFMSALLNITKRVTAKGNRIFYKKWVFLR
ncbi:MAG: aspartyl/asparaginyl beta-hydroxylase domain-containing protein [Legionellaceae bacterium]|nr:aspartyl/asparaginyl beta-hydroxylase domain-containing protein [Legionellaceae bacterium]MBP9774433.1 aspartyl/asparaginyl beta-hydroxylase domain-containing protein [Legionellaceae bacterium]